jgi:hypothetical protein
VDLRAAADRLHDDSSPLLLLHLLLVLGALDVLDRLERDRPMRGLGWDTRPPGGQWGASAPTISPQSTYPETVQK